MYQGDINPEEQIKFLSKRIEELELKIRAITQHLDVYLSQETRVIGFTVKSNKTIQETTGSLQAQLGKTL